MLSGNLEAYIERQEQAEFGTTVIPDHPGVSDCQAQAPCTWRLTGPSGRASDVVEVESRDAWAMPPGPRRQSSRPDCVRSRARCGQSTRNFTATIRTP